MIHEECGVFGIWQRESGPVANDVYAGLFALQHRGQEAAGIAVSRRGVFRHHKDVGLVDEVFSEGALDRLGEGNIAVGHVRYSTSGSPGRANAQPIVVRHRKGNMALCHNGNLINSAELREALEMEGCIFHTTSDTEVIAFLITRARLKCGSIEEALEKTMRRIEGAYSLILMSPSKLLAARDPRGFRPLCMGETKEGGTVFASETCALDAVGARFVRDLDPGEIVIADREDLRKQMSLYYVFPEQYRKPSMFGRVLFLSGQTAVRKCREDAMREILEIFREWNVTILFAYNALFDKGHLPELSGYVWKDIMKLAAYRQYNSFIPEDVPCCRTGRLKSGYGVERVMRMITQDAGYAEVHNALCDAEDELRIMQLLGHDAVLYPDI